MQTYKDHCNVSWLVFSLSFGQQGLAEAEFTGASLATSVKFEAQESIRVAPCNYERFQYSLLGFYLLFIKFYGSTHQCWYIREG